MTHLSKFYLDELIRAQRPKPRESQRQRYRCYYYTTAGARTLYLAGEVFTPMTMRGLERNKLEYINSLFYKSKPSDGGVELERIYWSQVSVLC